MSSIDQYLYKCIGVIECPSTYQWFGKEPSNDNPLHVAIYRLNQNIPADEDDFQGKIGDILLGGGSGEAPALRISIPGAFYWHTNIELFEQTFEWEVPNSLTIDNHVAKAYWTITQGYKFGEGYQKLGWTPDTEEIESWLTQHTLSFLVKYFPDEYSQYSGSELLKYDGSICRLLTAQEEPFWNWWDYLDPKEQQPTNPDKLVYQPIPKHTRAE